MEARKSVTARSILQIVDAPGRIVSGSMVLHRPDGTTVDLAQLHPRARRGNGAAPTPRDLGVDVAQDNFAMLWARRDADSAAIDASVKRLVAVLDRPEIEAMIRDGLLMVPGLLRGAALEKALAAQRESFAALRRAAGA